MDYTFVKDVSGHFQGTAYLYKLSEPIPYNWNWKEKKYTDETEYVVASGVHAMFSGPETYIFPADEEGKVLGWGELPGSQQGYIDPERAIRNLKDIVESGEYSEYD